MGELQLSMTIDELLANYDIEIVATPVEEYKTKEELKELRKEFKQFLKKHKHELGDYQVSIAKPHNTGFIVNFFAFTDVKNLHIMKRDVIAQGENLGLICDFCEQKLACLMKYEKEGKCAEDEEVRSYIENELSKEFNFNYPKERVIELLKENRFEPQRMGDVILKDAPLEKNGITIYI